LQTEDNRIDTSVDKTLIRHLFKFTNDMDKSIVYAYAFKEGIENRYTYFRFLYNATPNIYLGRIDLKPAGIGSMKFMRLAGQKRLKYLLVLLLQQKLMF
jgi:hypothetical protein